jgi:sialate O-acetylesterase
MDFSAAGYFFARKLNRDLKVPIGVIEAEWGATHAEAWTGATGLAAMNDFRDRVTNLIERADRLTWETDIWWSWCDPAARNGHNWPSPGRDVSGWKTMVQPKRWDSPDLVNFDGIVRFRKDITIPPALAGKPALLELGPVNDADIAYVNGIKVGSGSGDTFRYYAVPAGRLKAGANTIAVCVFDGGGTAGGMYGLPEQMNLKIQNGSGVVTVNLAGDWRYEVGTSIEEIEPYPMQLDPYEVTVIYNGMIAPLVRFPLKGVAWYQGESNAIDRRSIQYRTLLPTLIRDWRSDFGMPKLPFLVVQLAGYGDPVNDPVEQSDWSELREAQLLTTQTVPNCGLVVTADIGDSKNIHPKNKQDVGYRLALAAEGMVYGRTIEYSGPIYTHMKIEGRSIRLFFDHVGPGLVAKGSDLLEGFALAGADGKFIPATAVINGPTILVSALSITRPVAARYNWAGFPRGNLYNRAGLPASPFRTDR